MTTDGQWRDINVTSAVVADQNQGYTQYRVYFADDMGTTINKELKKQCPKSMFASALRIFPL
jgi:hypothetical protein